ncbi:hypothetical protein THRCLA_21807 [Thraustotheca clavata]|uniref:Calcineurin-like phosphoesterase domain-containing protein n=1 Tax=Thraustotheca clavata TaxID=74557 RepID=A0A1V9ZNP1_9STRA|nr:hypothetical protein THRCLA_21807 [Thraustotheca clavata]
MDTEERAEAFSSSRYRRSKLPQSLLIFSIVVAVGAAIGAVIGVIITIKYKAQQATILNSPSPNQTQQTQPESTALVSSSTPSSDISKESFDFHAFGIGNWAPVALPESKAYRTDSAVQKSIAELMAATAKIMPPQFILSHGGNLLLSGGQVKRAAQFDTLFTKIYADESLSTAPWLNVMGDVEYGGGNYLCSNYSTEATSPFISCSSNTAMLRGLKAKVRHIERSRHHKASSEINDTRWILRDQLYKYSAHSNGIVIDSFHLNLIVPKTAHVICCQCFGYGGSCPKLHEIDNFDEFPKSCAGGHESWYEDCRDTFDEAMDDAFDALKEALQLSSATWKIVHAYSSGLHDIPSSDQSKWFQLLNQFNVQLWINGHSRQASHSIFQTNSTHSPIHFWTNGLGGGQLPLAQKKMKAMWSDVKDGFLTLSFSTLWAKVQYLSPSTNDPLYCYYIPQSGLGSGQNC